MISAKDIATVGGEPLLVKAIDEPTDHFVLVGFGAEMPKEAAEQLRTMVRRSIERSLVAAELLGFPRVDQLRERFEEHPLLKDEPLYMGVGNGPIRLYLT
jgi:hypothetical protein